MPRVYKPDPRGKRYKKYTEDEITEAVKAYKTGNESLKIVAQKFNIDKSVLYRHATRTLKKHGGQTVLSEEVEQYIIEYINICGEWGYPFDSLDLRYLVKNYLDKVGRIESRFKNNLPGPEFATSFLMRHSDKISQRISQNIKKNRAKVSPDTIKKYFEELEVSLSGVDPKNIINYDETNLTDDPGRKKILVKRGTKYPERVVNHSKASTSLMIAAAADGILLPPYVVYKAHNLYDTWTANGPIGARYNRTESGWFDSNMFEDWFKSIVLPYFEGKEGKKCLVGDNLSSHISLDVIKVCKEKNIHFIFLPPNSTHLTQPLDVAFFRPMKMAWRNIMLKWKKTDGKSHTTIPKGCFPKLLKKLMEELHENSESNIKAGFRKTGICPIDVNEVLSRLPSEQNFQNDRDAVDQSVMDLLKELRYGSMNISEQKRKKKLNIIPGRSVGTDSWEYEETEEDENEPKIKKQKTTKDRKNIQISEDTEKKSGKEKGKGKGKKTKTQEEQKCNNETVNIIQLTDSEKKNSKGKGKGKKTKTQDEQISYNEIVNKIKFTNSEEKENKNIEGKGKCKEETTKRQDELIRDNEMMNIPDKNVTDLNVKNYFDYLDEDILKMPVILEEAMLCGDEVVIDYGIDKEIGNDEIPKEDDIVLSRYNFNEPKNERRESKVKITAESLPIVFEDFLACGEEVTLDNSKTVEMNVHFEEVPLEETCDKRRDEKKMRIISNEKLSDINIPKKVILNKCKKISLIECVKIEKNSTENKGQQGRISKQPSRSRRHFYKNDEDILKDLMDDTL